MKSDLYKPYSPGERRITDKRRQLIWLLNQSQENTKSTSKEYSLLQSLLFRTLMKASCGMFTLPNIFIFALPAFCFSNSFRFREISPP